MYGFNFDYDERIIIESEYSFWESKQNIKLKKLVLTNKYFYCIYEKSNGLFKKATEEVNVLSVSDIIFVNGHALVQQKKHHGLWCLQIQFRQGTEYFSFYESPKKVIPKWVAAINSTNYAQSQYIQQSSIPIQTDEYRLRFCVNCGAKLYSGTRFCPTCGCNVENINLAQVTKQDVSKTKTETSTPSPFESRLTYQKTINENTTQVNTQRQQEYVGKIYKCPNCGNIINNSDTVCNACGYRLSGKQAISSAIDFQHKMMEIEMTRKNTGSPYVVDEADKKILTLIRAYPIPNNIEDIVEFMHIAIGNIDVRVSKKTLINWLDSDCFPQQLSNAWVAKMQQIYKKAELYFPNESEFKHIKEIYDSTMKKLKITLYEEKYYMAIFGKRKTSGLTDEIRCDEPSYLIWKWHPSGSQSGNNNRENAIRWGSSLRVKDGEVAVFVYKQKDGTMQDFIVGPFDEIIKTKNFPVLASIVGLAYEGGTPFQAEIYFINLARIIQVNFGVPFFDVYDPRFSDFGVPVVVRGTISFNIKDYREYIKLHRLNSFNLDEFQKQIRDTAIRYIKDAVANAPVTYNIPLVQIETKIVQINDAIEHDISERLNKDFGVNVSGVDIGAIEVDKSNESFQKLMAVTKDVAIVKVKAETEDYVEKMRIQREEGQYAMHKQTQSVNIRAFQVEKQIEVGIASAEALGHMGENGGGGINLCGNGCGFNPVAMMTGMKLGGVVGQNIAGTMNNVLTGVNQVMGGMTPPPIPMEAYHVAINGQVAGPFDVNSLMQMASVGQFNADSLIWKVGMTEWVKAGTVDELKNVLASIPPIISAE